MIAITRSRRKLLNHALVTAPLIALVAGAGAVLYASDWAVLSAGGAALERGTALIVGQPVVGVASNDTYAIQFGALYGLQPAGCQSTASCPNADVNCDNLTDGFDIAVIRSGANWLLDTTEAAEPRADVNGDGVVDGFDIAAVRVAACWLQ